MKTIARTRVLTACLLAAACNTGSGDIVYPGPASPAFSVLTASPTEIKADGISTAVIKVQLRDQDARNLIYGGDFVDLSTTRGTLSPVVDNNNGTYTAILTSSTQVGTAQVGGSVNGGQFTNGDAIVTFLP